MAMLTLRISDDLNDRLTMMAEKTGRTKTWFVKKLIRQGLDDLEEEMLLEIMYKEFVAEGGRGTEPSIPLDELEAFFAQEDLEDQASKKRSEATKQTGPSSKKAN